MTVEASPALNLLTARALLQGSGDAEALENVVPTELPNGALCWVISEQRLYFLDKLSVTPVAPPLVIATVLGATVPGRWQQETGGGPPSGAAGGQLSGTYPNPIVVGITESAGPTALSIGAIANGQVLARSGGSIIGITPSGSPTGPAGGQLSGTYPNPAVSGITETSGPTALTIGAIADGQVLARSGSTVIGVTASGSPTGPAGGQLGGTYPNPDVRGITETSGPTALTIGAIADGQVLQRSGSNIIGVTASGSPTGPAGGQLSGTYPNPSVVGMTESGGPTALTVGAIANGQVLQRSGTSVVGVAAAFPPNGAAGGDLGGTYPNPSVAKITTTLGPTSLTIGVINDTQVLIRSGSQITSTAASFAPSGSAGGDLGGTYPNPTVRGVHDQLNVAYSIGTLVDGQFLKVNAGGAAIDSADPSLVPPLAVSGSTRNVSIGDENRIMLCSNAAGCSLTIPTNATQAFALGTILYALTTVANQVITWVAAGGVTMRIPKGKTALSFGEYCLVGAIKIGTNEWVLFGDLA